MLEALRRLNELPGDEMTLFVEDDAGRIVGTITDGDIRRALLAGYTVESSIDALTHRDFKYVSEGEIDLEYIRNCRNRGITMLPVLTVDKKIVSIINLNKVQTILPVSVIMMAGGKGERLRPLTLETPKPLLKIDDKAIIDYNIEALAACGVSDITVSTRYLSEKIFEHFENEVAGVKVKCIKEDKALGTLGAVSLVSHKPGGTTLVMNSDLLTTISFEDFYLYHKAQQADITIAVIPYQVSVPYAILTTKGQQVTGIEEKPSYSYYANAGIYMFENHTLDSLVVEERIDATDFIGNAIAAGKKVSFFPINGTWIDIGSPTDFSQAAEIMRHHRNMSVKN